MTSEVSTPLPSRQVYSSMASVDRHPYQRTSPEASGPSETCGWDERPLCAPIAALPASTSVVEPIRFRTGPICRLGPKDTGIDYGRTQPTRNPFYQFAQIHRDANPRAPASRESSGLVVDGLQAIDRRRDALVACLQLQGKELRVMARLMQIAAVEPQAFLLRRLPHVALFAFPWAGVLGRVRAEPPDLADLVGRVPADEVGHKAVHRAVAGRMDDYIGGQFLAIVDPDAVRRDFLDLTCGQLDLAVDDEVRGADIDVIAGAAPQIFHEQPGIIVAEIEPETGFR